MVVSNEDPLKEAPVNYKKSLAILFERVDLLVR